MIIGAVIGFLGSVVPKAFSMWEAYEDRKQELAIMDRQIERDKAVGAMNLEMINVDADIDETRSLLRHDAKLNSGASPWVKDLAASVRPVFTYLLLLMVLILVISTVAGWIAPSQFALMWGFLEALVSVVVGFWFGSRSLNRKAHT